MPKATKKKKEKHADFTKAKLKLGKGKKQASNATDTSFKARSIALPGQSNLNRALTETSEPVTNGGLTLDEVIIRFRHPNGGVRKETLTGLKDILSVGGISREVGKVVRALGGLVSDDDAGVRKSLLSFMGWYIPSIPETVLSPHLPLLLLQISSALSHIFPEIRLDASKLVSLLLSHVPKHVVGTWPMSNSTASSSKNTLDSGNNILQGLRLAVGLGGEAGQNAQMGKLGLQGRLTGLQTLLEFVTAALNHTSEDVFAHWMGDQRQNSPKGKGKGKEIVVSPEVISPFGWVVGNSEWGLERDCWEISRLGMGDINDGDSTISTLTELYLQLSPLLLSTFLEAAPTAFSPSSAPASTLETPIALCLTTASLTFSLTRPILQSSSTPEVRSTTSEFIRRMAPYFPFNAPSAPSPTGLTPSIELNLVYANLVILLAPNLPALELPKNGRKEVGWRERVKIIEETWKGMREVQNNGKGRKKMDKWAMDEVSDWIIDLLTPSQDILSPSLTPTTYSSILPIIWSLLTQPPAPILAQDDIPTKTGLAFVNHLLKQNSTSQIRTLGDGFLINLIRIHEQRYPSLPFFISLSSPVRKVFSVWIENLPKVLWELGTRDEPATRHLVAWLLEIGNRGKESFIVPYSLLSGLSFENSAQKMAVWFHMVHPSKGSTMGPWAKFSNYETRRLGLDMALAWSNYDKGALRNAVDVATKHKGGPDLSYWQSRVGKPV